MTGTIVGLTSGALGMVSGRVAGGSAGLLKVLPGCSIVGMVGPSKIRGRNVSRRGALLE